MAGIEVLAERTGTGQDERGQQTQAEDQPGRSGSASGYSW